MSKSKLMSYPQPVDSRCGCKVSWNYYADHEQAKAAAVAAEHNAEILADQGYDFGYQCPGHIKLMSGHTGEWARYNGLFEVCLP